MRSGEAIHELSNALKALRGRTSSARADLTVDQGVHQDSEGATTTRRPSGNTTTFVATYGLGLGRICTCALSLGGLEAPVRPELMISSRTAAGMR